MTNENGLWPSWRENKGFALLLGIFMVYSIVFLGVKIRESVFNSNFIGVADQPAPIISVTASAKATSVSDLATIDLGITNTAATAALAQTENTKKMNAMIAGMKELGIEAKDLKTVNYSVNPQYDYDRSPAVVVGYEASQTLTVTMRNQELVNSVVAKAGDLGATNIGSLHYTAEDGTVAEAQARAEAIAKAYEQGSAIAKAMGAGLGRVVSYSESNTSNYPTPFYASADSLGTNAPRPDIQPGQDEVTMTVYINYAIK